MTRSMNPQDRLIEILAQREKVLEAEQVLSSRAEKLAKAKASRDEAAADLSDAKRILEDIIDDRPAGPLFPNGTEAVANATVGRGAGDGPIRVPAEAVPAEEAHSQADADQLAAKRRAAKKK